MEELKHIRYRFLFPKDQQQQERVFTVFLDKQSHDLVQPVNEEKPIPEWAKLSFSKCRSCPLSDAQYRYCPAARSLVDVVEFFSDLPSFEETTVVVEMATRTITTTTTVQEGLRALMGLIMPTSGCPMLMPFKPMTFLHSPFGDLDETTFRSVAVHLLGQYFQQRYGGKASFDLQELVNLYEKAHAVNLDFLGRIRAASSNDANLNSLVSLDVFTMSVPRSIDNQLQKFLPLFLPPQDADEEGSSCR